MNTPTLDDLKCLVTWPPGSRGEQEESSKRKHLDFLDKCLRMDEARKQGKI